MPVFKSRVYKIFGWVTIVTAVGVLSLPYVAPFLTPSPEKLKQWAVHTLVYPIELKAIDLTWEGLNPRVNLTDVEIYTPDRSAIALQARSIKLSISLIDILLQRLHIKKLIIDGANIGIEYQDNHLIIAGLPAWKWDFNRQHSHHLPIAQQIIIENSNIHLMTLAGTSVPFTDLTLWVDTHRYAKVRGHAKLLGLEVATVDFGLDLPDKKHELAQFYTHIQGAELSQFASLWDPKWPKVQEGTLEVEWWAQIKQNNEINTQAKVKLQHLKGLNNQEKTFEFANISGEIQAKYKNKDWHITGHQWFIQDLPDSKNPAINFKIKSYLSQKDPCWEFKSANLPISATLGWLKKLNFLQDSARLSSLQVKGNLDYVHFFAIQKNSQWVLNKAKAAFSEVDLAVKDPALQLKSLSGAVKLVDNSGKLLIYSPDLTFHYPKWFNHSLSFAKTQLWLDWEILSEKKIFKAKFETPLFSGVGNINFLEDRQWPLVDMVVNAQAMSVSEALTFLPKNYLSKELVNWLEGSLSGDLLGASMVFRGSVGDFPFDHKEGLFEVLANVENVNLKYAPDWPQLTDVFAQLRFINRAMVISQVRGRIGEETFEEGEAIIANLGAKRPLLNVDAKLHTRLEHGLAILQKTPLKDTATKAFKGLNLVGESKLSLGLDIPISEDLTDLKVRGLLELHHAATEVPAWDLSLKNINGAISFTENKFKGENLTANLFESPVQLHIASDITTSPSPYEVILNGSAKLALFQKWLKVKNASFIDGQTDYMAHLIAQPITNELSLTLKSSLMGMTIAAPDGLGKTAEQARPLEIKFRKEANDHVRMSAKYGDNVNATLSAVWRKQQWQPLGAHLHFGEKRNAKFREDQIFLIDGELATLEVSKWQTFLQNTVFNTSSNATTWQLEPLVELEAQQLQLWGIPFGHTKAEVRVEQPWHWFVNLSGKSLKGKVDLPLAEKNAPISVDFQTLAVPEKQDKNAASFSVTQPNSPLSHPIDIKIQHLILGKKQLHQVQARFEPTEKGYYFPHLQAKLKGTQLGIKGDWDFVNMPSQVKARGKVETQNAGQLLGALGLAPAIERARGVVDFNLQWQGTPAKIDTATLSGQADLSLRQGYMTGVNPGLSRILNLLSIDNVHRRLNLDFSDVTKNGFAFDELHGKFQFIDGKMISNNIQMVGPSAQIAAWGQVDLSTHQLAGEMMVMPNVTGSLPIAAAIAAGHPAVGAAVWVVDKMFKSKIQEINRFNYQISGTWQTPLVQEVSVLKG